MIRQLRDIQENMYLTELVSHEPEAIQGQLHHTRCIYNALADVKPEVESTIKMGRKLVDLEAVPEPAATSANIDSLKELFNVLGAAVTEARGTLEKALEVSASLMSRVGVVLDWLGEAERELGEVKGKAKPGLLESKVSQMREMKIAVRELLGVKAEFLGLVSDPSLLGGLGELLAGLEARWNRLKALLEEELSEGGEVEDTELPDLALDLESCSISSGSVERTSAGLESGPGEETSPALLEFRAVFQEVSAWLDTAEKRLERVRRASEDRQLEEQVVVLGPKVESLATMAVRVAEQFVGQREDVQGEMVSLGGRWEAVVSKIRERPGFSLVEVEQIRTTISQLVIPPSSLQDEEEIMTLPEESSQSLSSGGQADGRKEESRSPCRQDSKSPCRQDSRSPSGETRRLGAREMSKSPPPTLPKPRWYLESRQSSLASGSSSPPVKQVVVTSSTLPSPRCLGPPPLECVQPQLTTQPSATRAPDTELIPGSPLPEHTAAELAELEQQNDRDNEIIDRLLRGASEDIEDVKKRSISRGQAAQSRDKKDFLDSCSCLLARLAAAQARLKQLGGEADLELRTDLVEMEIQELEAAVATTISRGETLLLLIHRQSAEQAKGLQDRLATVREEWGRTKQLAEQQKAEARVAEKELERFTSICSGLLVWLENVEARLEAAKDNSAQKEAIFRELEARQVELDTANSLAAGLRRKGALKGLEASLTQCNFRWQQCRQESGRRSKSKSISPGLTRKRTEAAEITSRMSRVREAIAAVETQLRTTVLQGRRFENLAQQQEMLDTVRAALETLRPKVRRAEKEVEGLSCGLAMEQYEKMTGQAEKCRAEWAAVNSAYQVAEPQLRGADGPQGGQALLAPAERICLWPSLFVAQICLLNIFSLFANFVSPCPFHTLSAMVSI